MTLAFAGFLAGFVHVLSGPDHLAAIAPYAVDGKSKAWRTGVRWGLGHTAGVFGVAVMALLLRHALPIERLSVWGERCVGLVLIAIGIWGVGTALAARTANDQHRDRRHVQAHGHDHRTIEHAVRPRRAATVAPRSPSERSTGWQAVRIRWESCRRWRCPPISPPASTFSCSARAASPEWGRSHRSSAGSQAGRAQVVSGRKQRCWG